MFGHRLPRIDLRRTDESSEHFIERLPMDVRERGGQADEQVGHAEKHPPMMRRVDRPEGLLDRVDQFGEAAQGRMALRDDRISGRRRCQLRTGAAPDDLAIGRGSKPLLRCVLSRRTGTRSGRERSCAARASSSRAKAPAHGFGRAANESVVLGDMRPLGLRQALTAPTKPSSTGSRLSRPLNNQNKSDKRPLISSHILAKSSHDYN